LAWAILTDSSCIF
jgi:hypothetical protein